MSLSWTLTAYCDSCGTDIAETDSDDLDNLVQSLETRADLLYVEHVKTNQCR